MIDPLIFAAHPYLDPTAHLAGHTPAYGTSVLADSISIIDLFGKEVIRGHQIVECR